MNKKSLKAKAEKITEEIGSLKVQTMTTQIQEKLQ